MFIEAGGQRFNTVSFGAGEPPLVMVGGWIGTWQVWRFIIEQLSAERRCVAYDHRGAGQTVADLAGLNPEQMADDVLMVLDALDVDRCWLAGESQGGYVAFLAALRAPERFHGLVMVDTTAVNAPSDAGDRFIAALEEDRERAMRSFVGWCIPEPDTDHLKRWLLQTLLESQPEAGPALLRQMQVDITDRLADMALPTLVIHGDKDILMPVDQGRVIAEGIPGAKLVVMPDTGHVPMITRPVETAEAIRSFIAAHS